MIYAPKDKYHNSLKRELVSLEQIERCVQNCEVLCCSYRTSVKDDVCNHPVLQSLSAVSVVRSEECGVTWHVNL